MQAAIPPEIICSARIVLLRLTLLCIAPVVGCQLGASPGATLVCQPDGICLDAAGRKVYANGELVPCSAGGACSAADLVVSGSGDSSGSAGADAAGNSNGIVSIASPTPRQGDCRAVAPAIQDANDRDGDCIPNDVEMGYDSAGVLHTDPNQFNSDPNLYDTDGDGLGDGFEDWNHDGIYSAGIETNPRQPDTDGDGLCDGFGGANPACLGNWGEDHNGNGVQDPGETSPLRYDTDGDGICDGGGGTNPKCAGGGEDRNNNGQLDTWVDVNGNGCFDAGIDTPGETSPLHIDTDADGILDGTEDRNHNGLYEPQLGETAAFLADTDCDGIADGLEDRNHSGYVDAGETDPRQRDTDGDGLFDGYNPHNPYEPTNGGEDRNNNGHLDPGETDPLRVDSDGDGIADGVEDRNHNGQVDAFVDTNGNGIWDAGEVAGESDPRLIDTDGDGISDGLEDVNHNGLCDTAELPDPLGANGQVLSRQFVETCAWRVDTDGDGLADGIEDNNKNGRRDTGETDPRQQDSDFDGLTDGCPPRNATAGCEDKNNNGIVDAGETDPRLADTDGDGLADGCELRFGPHPPAGGTDPLNEDTDGDGVPDGEEDANHNCQLDPTETDPRVFDAPPPSTDPNYVRFNVCGTANLNPLTYAASGRTDVDARVAFEVERQALGACPQGGCPAGQSCLEGRCVVAASYSVQAFGTDLDGNGFAAEDANDKLLGWTFTSPAGVVQDAATGLTPNRDVYGFVLLGEEDGALDDYLDGVRAQLIAAYTQAQVTEVENLPARPAFDTLPHNRTAFAQRQLTLDFFAAQNGSLWLRNTLLVQQFLAGQAPNPAAAVPTVDPVYGRFTCPQSPLCYANYTLSIGAVQRLDQLGPHGLPTVITVVALTENDSNQSAPTLPQNRFYADRLTRLGDLTGGSAVAHFAADTTHACDSFAPTQALADLLFVADDSRSMQQIISRIQQAADAAQAVLTSNAGIVNFRVGMTTTNPSSMARTQCQPYCNAAAMGQSASGAYVASDCDSTCVDQALGCIKVCNTSCTSRACANGMCTCGNSNAAASCPGTANPEVDCNVGTCLDPTYPSVLSALLAQDAITQGAELPGGGGTFYYEDSQFLDCDSSNIPQGDQYTLPYAQYPFLNQCTAYATSGTQYPYATGDIPQFFGPHMARKQFFQHAGMLGSDANAQLSASCSLAPMDLRYSTSAAANGSTPACQGNTCCQRLTSPCDDGPTVLGSQMCDLIRAMGGLPGQSAGASTSGARRHSAPEQGSRSARRLLQGMLPALPADYAQYPDASHYDPKGHLRLACQTSDTCRPCDPTRDANCVPVPLATVFLSDEEDFYFKDDCAAAQQDADKRQLPELCYHGPGIATTGGACTPPAGSSTNPNGDTPYAYCEQVANTGWPQGYDPDQAAWTSDASYTLRWRDAGAPQCHGADACVTDACEVHAGQAACSVDGNCLWSQNASTCIDAYCATYTRSIVPATVTAAAAEAAACRADARCRWDVSQLQANQPQVGACLLAVPPNDCAACKRLLRTRDAVAGEPNLIGFGQVGPIYAVTRTKGAPGFGGVFASAPQDTCGGGSITWGRGDGQAYRDLAAQTLGRTQDVCAGSYTTFMALVVGDLAALSKPYPLSGTPIATTLKVGIRRPSGSGGAIYVPVPRSVTSGFFYDPTVNSIAFKSDPVDGQCGNLSGGCSANGIIEPNEILYATQAPIVPRAGDTIYLSYRVWQPIPCLGACLPGEVCAEVVCQTLTGSHPCPAPDPSQPALDPNGFCPPGSQCRAGACVQDCSPGELVEGCVNRAACGVCESYDPNAKLCLPIDDGCVCNASGQISCVPSGAAVCGPGYFCGLGCSCEPTPGCQDGVFGASGAVSDCAEALACCATFAANAAASGCASKATASACEQNVGCIWTTTSLGPGCAARQGPCCGAGETATCTADTEGSGSTLYCAPQVCTCQCPAGYECDPAAPTRTAACACYYNGG